MVHESDLISTKTNYSGTLAEFVLQFFIDLQFHRSFFCDAIILIRGMNHWPRNWKRQFICFIGWSINSNYLIYIQYNMHTEIVRKYLSLWEEKKYRAKWKINQSQVSRRVARSLILFGAKRSDCSCNQPWPSPTSSADSADTCTFLRYPSRKG